MRHRSRKDTNILVVQLSRMGDLVQSLPLLKRFREEKPSARITLLCVREFSPILRNTPLVDRFIEIPHETALHLAFRDGRSNDPVLDAVLDRPELWETYDLVVNLTHDLGSASLCRKIRSREVSGVVRTEGGETRVLGAWAKYLFSFSEARRSNLFNLVDIYIGMGGMPHRPVRDCLEPGATERRRVEEILAEAGSAGGGPRVAFQTGANRRHRAWPVERYAELGRRLRETHGVEIVLIGSPGERDLADAFQARADYPFLDLVGKTSVPELPALLEACDLLISHDTGPIHVAAAVGTSVLGLFFSTAYFAETAPYGEGHVILQAELPCVPCHERAMCPEASCRTPVTVDAVAQTARAMIRGEEIPLPGTAGLSVFRSAFLSNGTLVYRPPGGRADLSEHFRVGFLNRLLWEPPLGLAPDDAFVGEYLPAVQASGDFAPMVDAYRAECEALQAGYGEGAAIARKILKTAARRPDRIDMISPLIDGLRRIEGDIARSAVSLMSRYHNLDLMDADFHDCRELAAHFLDRYTALSAIVRNSRKTLSNLSN
jgi:ADP-heptose:LPS heptosyltransferase